MSDGVAIMRTSESACVGSHESTFSEPAAALQVHFDSSLDRHMLQLRSHLDAWMLRQEALYHEVFDWIDPTAQEGHQQLATDPQRPDSDGAGYPERGPDEEHSRTVLKPSWQASVLPSEDCIVKEGSFSSSGSPKAQRPEVEDQAEHGVQANQNGLENSSQFSSADSSGAKYNRQKPLVARHASMVQQAVQFVVGHKGFDDFETIQEKAIVGRMVQKVDAQRASQARISGMSTISASLVDQKKKNLARQVSIRQRSSFVADHELFAGGKQSRCAVTRSKIEDLVKNTGFEVFFGFLILTNSLFVGIEVEYNASNPSGKEDLPVIFYIGGHFYALFFLIELLLRITAEGLAFLGCRGTSSSGVAWNFLDVFIVVSSLVEMVLDVVRLSGGNVGNLHETSNIRIARIMKISRLLRVIRVLRVVRVLRALRTLVYGIMCTLKSMIWSMLLLFLVMYIFGIIFTQAATERLRRFSDKDTLKYWGTLPRSVYTLFQVISNGLSWEDSVKPLSDMGWFYVALFNFFVAFMLFAMLNVMTGVFCQSAIESAQHDYDLAVHSYLTNKEAYLGKIREVFAEIDDHACGEVSLDKFEEYLENEQVRAYFASLGLEPNDAWTLFKLLDRDETCVLDLEEFMWGCLRLRGPASALELAKLEYESKVLGKTLTATLRRIEQQICQTREKSTVVVSTIRQHPSGSRGSRQAAPMRCSL